MGPSPPPRICYWPPKTLPSATSVVSGRWGGAMVRAPMAQKILNSMQFSGKYGKIVC